MFEVSIKTRFSAAHHLAGYPGTCAAQHGHNWDVEVFLQGETLNDTGILADFREVRRATEEVLGELDHADLNALPYFQDQNPSSENIARHLFDTLSKQFGDVPYHVSRVTVGETPESRASYWAS